MCNACNFTCCASDQLEGCGCHDCSDPGCAPVNCCVCGEPLDDHEYEVCDSCDEDEFNEIADSFSPGPVN